MKVTHLLCFAPAYFAVALAAHGADIFGDGLVKIPTTASGGTGAVADLQADDDVQYTVSKGATASIGGFGAESGTIDSVHLFVQYSVDPGYTGTNALQVNGIDTGIVPAERDYGRWVHVDLTAGAFGIDTSAEIEGLSVSFANNDGGGDDPVIFDCVYVVVNPTSPIPSLPTWSEDFNGTGAANPMVWTYEEGYKRNNELQYYVPGTANGWMEGGNFIIEGRRESIYAGHDYTSASIVTSNKYYWKFGRAQIRAKIPASAGMWPAIWGTGEVGQWPHNGEVDIMEYYGDKILANCAVGTTVQWQAKWDSSNRSMSSLTAVDPAWKSQWHIWTMQWDDLNVRIYCDNILLNTIPQTWLKNTDGYNTSWGPQYPFLSNGMSCWLNLAIGGNAGGDPSGTAFPQRYLIDYWKIWEGATDNVAPTDIVLDSDSVQEGLPAGAVVGNLRGTDADPAEVHRYALVAGTGDTHNSQFNIPEFVSDSTLAGVLKTTAVLNYADGSTRSIRVRVTDVEGMTYEKVLTVHVSAEPMIEVTPNPVLVAEGGTRGFEVRLLTLPAGDITVNVSRQSGDSDITVSSGSTLTFTPANGIDWQTVMLTAAEDADRSNGTTMIICEDGSGVYAAATVEAIESDNDNLAPVVDAGVDQVVYLTAGSGGGEDPVAGAYLEWDAAADPPGNNTWTSTTANTYNWTFDAGALSPEDVNDPRFDRLTKAYIFPAAQDATNASWDGFGTTQPATFEFVIDVDGADGSIFECGGSGDGMQVDVVGGVLRGTVQESTPARVQYTLTPTDLDRFIHVVFVADNAGDVVRLYVDGVLRDTAAWTGPDWAGTDAPSLGEQSGTRPTDGSVDPYVGKMALFRFYQNKALTAGEVETNFSSLFTGSNVTVPLDGTAGDPEGDPITTTWSLVSGPAGIGIADPGAIDTTATFNVAGSYVLRLSAEDGVGSASDELTVTVGSPNTYSAWSAGTFAHAFTQTAINLDPDSDGVGNLLEFAFGLDPTAPDGTTLDYVSGAGLIRPGVPMMQDFAAAGQTPDYRAVFVRRKDHAAAGLSYTVQFSAELLQWTASIATPTILTGAESGGDYEVVSVPFDASVPAFGGSQNLPPHFFRVGVQLD